MAPKVVVTVTGVPSATRLELTSLTVTTNLDVLEPSPGTAVGLALMVARAGGPGVKDIALLPDKDKIPFDPRATIT